MRTNRKGNILIISTAPGAGKTTLVSRLSKNNGDIRVSISHTIRQPCEGERHDVHYHFIPKGEFKSLICQSAFLEHADIFGNYYGTSIAGVGELRGQGYDVVLEIDAQEVEQIRRFLSEVCSVFVLPPSFEILASRLTNRGTNSEEVIRSRLDKARCEVGQAPLLDYIVVNDDLDTAKADLLHIIKAGCLKQTIQKPFIEDLLKNS